MKHHNVLTHFTSYRNVIISVKSDPQSVYALDLTVQRKVQNQKKKISNPFSQLFQSYAQCQLTIWTSSFNQKLKHNKDNNFSTKESKIRDQHDRGKKRKQLKIDNFF